MRYSSPSPSDSSDPVRVVLTNYVSSDNEAYFRKVMNCLVIAYGDEYSNLSSFEIKCLSLRFCENFWYDYILECLKPEFGCSAVDVYKVCKSGQSKLACAFPRNNNIPKEVYDAVSDAVDPKSDKTTSKTISELAHELNVETLIVTKAIDLHPQVQAETAKLDAYWLWCCGTEKISLIAELVGIPEKEVFDFVDLWKDLLV